MYGRACPKDRAAQGTDYLTYSRQKSTPSTNRDQTRGKSRLRLLHSRPRFLTLFFFPHHTQKPNWHHRCLPLLLFRSPSFFPPHSLSLLLFFSLSFFSLSSPANPNRHPSENTSPAGPLLEFRCVRFARSILSCVFSPSARAAFLGNPVPPLYPANFRPASSKQQPNRNKLSSSDYLRAFSSSSHCLLVFL